MTKTLYYAGEPGEGYGWGICNKYLIQELGKLCDVRALPSDRVQSIGFTDFAVFMPIADHDLNPAMNYWGGRTFGYTFFEYPLGPKALENSKLYDLIFCGSTWCKERLAERGIHNTEVLIQGVDHEIFKPEPHPCTLSPQDFRIFSGGKFEYRKGQDIVLAAFKLLQDKYPQMRLVASWVNLWPALHAGMSESKHLKMPSVWHENTWRCVKEICELNGIDYSRITWLGNMPQPKLADAMRSTDLGVFPNRCEGGTNLVLMEYLACGKPALASHGTGHVDIYEPNNSYFRVQGTLHPDGWLHVEPSELAEQIENVYHNYDALNRPPNLMQQYTWRRAAEQILSHI